MKLLAANSFETAQQLSRLNCQYTLVAGVFGICTEKSGNYLGKNLRSFLVVLLGKVLERADQAKVLSQRVPSQVTFFVELLHVFWCRPSRASLKQPSTSHQGND